MHCAITSIEEFYAHALAIEREAAERYAELAAHFHGRGEEALASLCRKLAILEREHYHQLVHACEGLTIPMIPASQYRWLEEGAPETAAREIVYRATHPRDLLRIALEGELRARAFFVWIARSASTHAVKELASIMAAEEAEHVRWVQDALDRYPDSPDRETMLASGFGPGALAS